MEAFSSWRHCSACFPFLRRCSPTAVIKDRNLRKGLQRFCRISTLKSSNVPIRSADLWSCQNAGSSSAPLPGSIAAEGSPRIGRISTERRSRSCASPQSASCSENSAIRPEVSGQTLRVKYCCNTCSWILYKFEFLAETKPRKPNANDNVSDISRILSPQAKLISRLSPETNRRNYDEPRQP